MEQFPLFVYGTLLSTQKAYPLLAPAVARSAIAWIDGATLHDLGPYPMLVAGSGRVFGEAHWLNPTRYTATLHQLDAYEGKDYERVLRPVQVDGLDRPVQAWVYVGNLELAMQYPLVLDGRWNGARNVGAA
ncbi:MAG: gamma-glutamylcyclotransferase [Caldilineaceae bacterium]|nr:gamma-glutamylcyclotransferase [Caldilineaceae bacterium]